MNVLGLLSLVLEIIKDLYQRKFTSVPSIPAGPGGPDGPSSPFAPCGPSGPGDPGIPGPPLTNLKHVSNNKMYASHSHKVASKSYKMTMFLLVLYSES